MPAEIANHFLQELLEALEQHSLALPALPEVALRVRDAVAMGKPSKDGVSRIIASDAALSERLIRIANSPLLHTGEAAGNLEAAVDQLGIKYVRDLVISMVLEQLFHAGAEPLDKKLRQLWEHSVTVGAISFVLATNYTTLSPTQAMLAGLVHGIGILPILARAESYPQLMEDEAALQRIIARLHPLTGAAVLTAWQFPGEMVKVPAEHENLSRDSAQTDYVDVVTVANLQSYLGSDHPLAMVDWRSVPAFDKLRISPEVNVLELAETAEAIREAQRLIGA